MMVLFLLFFGVLHVFFNMFAVMLRHADRLFYENWWSACRVAGRQHRAHMHSLSPPHRHHQLVRVLPQVEHGGG